MFLVLNIDGAVSFKDAVIHESEKIEDSSIEFSYSDEYKYATVIDGISYCSKDGERYGVCVGVRINGTDISNSLLVDIFNRMDIYGEVRADIYEEVSEEGNT